MMTLLATALFTVALMAALTSLVWDLTRPLVKLEAEDALALAALAEARRIAALPRPLAATRGIGRAAPAATASVATPVRRPLRPALAVAA